MALRRIGLAVLTLIAPLVLAGQTDACTGEQPTFAEAVVNADAIARVVVDDVTEYGEPPAGETFRVIRVLKGELPEHVRLDDPRTSLCGDTIGTFAPEGSEVIVAFGVPFYETLVNPAWKATDSNTEPVTGAGAPAPAGVASLDELEMLIRASLPDTAVAAGTRSAPALVVGSLSLLAAAAVVARRLRPT